MNKVILIGNLVKDPEITTTTNNNKVASFSIAVNDGKDQSQFFNIKAWNKQAELVEMYVKKGHKICIIGKIQIRKYEKNDGSTGYSTEITASELEFLTSKKESQKTDNYDYENDVAIDLPSIKIDNINF